VRETVEKQTDRYFFHPWLVLNQAESVEMQELLAKTKDQLEQLIHREPIPA
jgi:hypothetical protein